MVSKVQVSEAAATRWMKPDRAVKSRMFMANNERCKLESERGIV